MAPPRVLVTCRASGVGETTARAFRESGWAVYATDPVSDRLSRVLERYLRALH